MTVCTEKCKKKIKKIKSTVVYRKLKISIFCSLGRQSETLIVLVLTNKTLNQFPPPAATLQMWWSSPLEFSIKSELEVEHFTEHQAEKGWLAKKSTLMSSLFYATLLRCREFTVSWFLVFWLQMLCSSTKELWLHVTGASSKAFPSNVLFFLLSHSRNRSNSLRQDWSQKPRQ